MSAGLIAAATALLALIPLAGFAQDLATDVLKADIEAVLNSPDGGVDRQISVVDIGKLNVAVGVLHRGPTGDSDRVRRRPSSTARSPRCTTWSRAPGR